MHKNIVLIGLSKITSSYLFYCLYYYLIDKEMTELSIDYKFDEYLVQKFKHKEQKRLS